MSISKSCFTGGQKPCGGWTYGKAVITLERGLFGAGVAKPGNAHALRACGPLGPGSSNLPPGATRLW